MPAIVPPRRRTVFRPQGCIVESYLCFVSGTGVRNPVWEFASQWHPACSRTDPMPIKCPNHDLHPVSPDNSRDNGSLVPSVRGILPRKEFL